MKKDGLFHYLTIMKSTQICPNEKSSTQAGEMGLSQEQGCFTAFLEKFQKFEEWYANANIYFSFFFISRKNAVKIFINIT